MILLRPNANRIWFADYKRSIPRVDLDCSISAHVDALLQELLAQADKFEDERKTECHCVIF